MLAETYDDRTTTVGANLHTLRVRRPAWRVARVRRAGPCLTVDVRVTWRSQWWPGRQRHDLVARLLPRDGEWDVNGLGPPPAAPAPVWALGRVQVVASPDSRVVLVGIRRPARRATAARLASARRDVLRAIGHHGVPVDGRAPLVTWLVPSHRPLARLIGRPSAAARGYAGLTSLTSGRLDRPGLPVVIADASTLSARPRDAWLVLRHEVVHALSGAVGSQAPTWVTEGYAEDVAARLSGHRPGDVEPYLRHRLSTGHVPRDRLPSEADFRSHGPRLAQAYQLSALAVRAVRSRAGRGGVRRFYTATLDAADHHARRPPLTLGLRAAGVTRAEVLAEYQRLLRRVDDE